MYRSTYQGGRVSILFSGGAKPLSIWDTCTRDGYIASFLDQDIKSMVLEIGGTNISTSYVICPKGKQVLGIMLPFFIMVVKNLKKYFSFEVTILDDSGVRRRFRVANFQSTTQIMPLCTAMPINLADGWNQIQLNLAEFTRRAYGKQFVEVQKVKINANIRIRRVYFAERLLPDEELPPAYKLFFPLVSKGRRDKKTDEETKPAAIEEQTKVDVTIVAAQDQVKDEAAAVKRPSVQEERPETLSEAATVKTETEGTTAPEGTEPSEPGETPAEEPGEAPSEAAGEAPEPGEVTDEMADEVAGEVAGDATGEVVGEVVGEAPADETPEEPAEGPTPETPAE